MEERIIEFVRENRFLYDKNDKSYKNIFLRNKKFEELALELNKPERAIKERWRTLRDKYVREHRLSKMQSGRGQHKWKWMASLSFLDEVISENTSTNNVEVKPMVNNDSSFNLYVEESSPTDPCISEIAAIDEEKIPAKRRKKDGTFSAIKAAEKDLDEIIQIAKEHFARADEKTSKQLFFDMMAQQVEELNLSTMQFSMLQVLLQKTLQIFISKRK